MSEHAEHKAGKHAVHGKKLDRINEGAPEFGRVEFKGSVPFGATLILDKYVLQNGLDVLLVVDRSAPVIAYHTWYRVGSRHERPGKTGLAHLFEHLMFNEVEGLPPGAFDTKMEAAGADNNASTWLDFTQYQEAFPKAHLATVVDLESRRMQKLVLREPQVTSEKEVVKNERRYRVDDDVEGTVEELLWKTAFQVHPYHAPTIGWMEDIEGLSTEDCDAFYRAYYAPNNASLIVVGDLDPRKTLRLVSSAYGEIAPFEVPLEDSQPEPPQLAERVVEIEQPTPTEKLVVGYKGPALGDADHVAATLLIEILTGSAASRIRRRLVRTDKLASEVSGYVGPHSHPSLIEFSAAARTSHSGEDILRVVDEEIERIKRDPVTAEELARARSRMELGLLGSLETADGKASTIGFYQCVLGSPTEALARLERARNVTVSDIRVAARRYLNANSRTTIFVRAKNREAL